MKKIIFLLIIIFAAAGAFAMGTPPNSTTDNFLLNDLSGKPISLDSYKGHVVLVAFFTTWCPSCQDEMPQLEQLYNKYRSREFSVLGVNIKGTKEEVKSFMDGYKLTFPVVLDDDGSVSMQYKVRYIPRLFLFDKSGKVIFNAQYLPYELIEKEVAKALQ